MFSPACRVRGNTTGAEGSWKAFPLFGPHQPASIGDFSGQVALAFFSADNPSKSLVHSEADIRFMHGAARRVPSVRAGGFPNEAAFDERGYAVVDDVCVVMPMAPRRSSISIRPRPTSTRRTSAARLRRFRSHA